MGWGLAGMGNSSAVVAAVAAAAVVAVVAVAVAAAAAAVAVVVALAVGRASEGVGRSRAVTTRPGILVGLPKNVLRTAWGLTRRSTAFASTRCGTVPFRTPTHHPGPGQHVRAQKNTGPEH